MYQLVITISILTSQILGMKVVLGTEDGWPWLLGCTLVPAIIQACNLITVRDASGDSIEISEKLSDGETRSR